MSNWPWCGWAEGSNGDSKMLSAIGKSAICMHGPGHHLETLVWLDPLANKPLLVNPRDVQSRGARIRTRLMVISSLGWGE